jgi:hypothetical protein
LALGRNSPDNVISLFIQAPSDGFPFGLVKALPKAVIAAGVRVGMSAFSEA